MNSEYITWMVMFVVAGINYVTILGKVQWGIYQRKKAFRREVAEYWKRRAIENAARQECLKLSSPYR